MITLTSSEMKYIDIQAVKNGDISATLLMNNAAKGVYDVIVDGISEEVDSYDHCFFIACGPGNNGGDGFALANMLHSAGYTVAVYFVGIVSKMTDETTYYYNLINGLVSERIVIISTLDEASNHISRSTLLIDALFGFNCSRPIIGDYATLIDMMNHAEKPIIAIDLPSGIHADHGQVLGIAIRATKTVTFTLPKVGLYLYPGSFYTGEIILKQIGIPSKYIEDVDYEYEIIDDSYLKLLPKRRIVSHKGIYGKIIIIAGSMSMCGAAILSAKAAYRSGSGLVRIITELGNQAAIFGALPEAVISTYEKEEKAFLFFLDSLKEQLEQADAILIGPGLGTDTYAIRLVALALQMSHKKIVVDADGLSIIASNLQLIENTTSDIIVTPHIGEMSRLTGYEGHDILNNTVEFAKAFNNRYQVVTVLKSARTIVAVKNKIFINILGHSGMATAGSGDVLAGIIVSLLGQGSSTALAGVLGVYVHAKASHAMLGSTNAYSMMASDIIEGLNFVL
ncbi:MAG: NAD(P)H-hydrate dehydratase [Vallitaleaceae bacterium]|jgi:hydroxyethylthiazole kinase-like uncharacterized protein yjeF|nr:NAD(P)H-hydrate dehydratase [Vallitaleaceae bacterium]